MYVTVLVVFDCLLILLKEQSHRYTFIFIHSFVLMLNCLWVVLVFIPGESYDYLGVQELLHRSGATAGRSGGSQGDGKDE